MDRIPSNHRLAERQIIPFVSSGELEIDAQGQVWRSVTRIGNGRSGGSRLVPITRRRAEHQTSKGYLQVAATINGKQVYCLAHRLVWHYFYGAIPPGKCINHINGVKDDNRPQNLEVVSYSENLLHASEHGLLKDQHGEANHQSKLTEEDVAAIRRMRSEGMGLTEIANRFGINFRSVSHIVHRRRWDHV